MHVARDCLCFGGALQANNRPSLLEIVMETGLWI